MSVATDFRAWLLTQPAIAQRVGNRVCLAFVQETAALPYIVFRESGGNEETDLDGEGGHEVTTFDVEIRASTQAEADAIAIPFRKLVNGFPKAAHVGAQRTWNQRPIQFASVMDASEDYEIIPVGNYEQDAIKALILEVHSDG